jgi:cytochrome c oxidase subunit 3
VSVVIVFLVVVIGFSLWWLTQQRVLSRPWLEVGPDPAGGPEDITTPAPKLALAVFLAVVGALFALFASAYFMRMEFVDWRPMPVPRLLWLNTAILVLASVLLQCALVASRHRDVGTARLGLAAGGVATLGFLAGQLAAWRALEASGYIVTGNPANSFFYLLTGLHGLHLVGGLVALAVTLPLAWQPAPQHLGRDPEATPARAGRLTLRLELCAMYWHFLLLVWLGLLALFTGWAAGLVVLCRQILT